MNNFQIPQSSIKKNKIRKLTLRPPDFSSPKTAHTQPTCQKSITNPTTLKLCLNKKKIIRQERINSQMLRSEPVSFLKNITSKLFPIKSIFFQIIIFFILDTFKLFISLFLIVCSFFIIFCSLHKTHLNYAKILDHLLGYNFSTTI